MSNRFSKLGIIFCATYLSLCIVALLLIIIFADNSPLIAIYMIGLTIPWSLIWGIVIIILYFTFENYTPTLSVGIVLLTLSSIVNTIIIYKICKKGGSKGNNKGT